MRTMKHSGLIAMLVAGLTFGGAAARADDNAGAKGVTFSKDVAPIFQNHCNSCHRPGDIGPMSLLSYQDARPWAKAIKKNVADQLMPPWHADPKYGKFSNDSSLTADQIRTITAWVEQGAPEGDPADMPPARQYDHDGWKLGVPDVVWEPKTTYTLAKSVDDEYRCFVIPTGLTEDVWVKAFEVKPNNKKVVHHIMPYVATADKAQRFIEKDAASPEPGFLCGMGGGAELGLDSLLGGWAPGNEPRQMSAGVGRLMPAGSYIVYQVHYHNTTGEDQPDRSNMAAYFAREPIHKRPRVVPVSQWDLKIPAGEPNARHHAEWKVPFDITISSIMNHMHFIGKDMKVTAVWPDGREEILLSTPRYDFNWQTTYHLATPLKAPKGMILKMDSVHDNSASNKANPHNPPIDVKWGEATDEEMAIAWVGYTKDDEDLNVTPKPPVNAAGRLAVKPEKVSASVK